MHAGRTIRSSKSHGGKRKGYDAFDERHGVRGRSRSREGSRCTEENRKTMLVREGREETPLYTLNTLDTSCEVCITNSEQMMDLKAL